MRRSPCPSGFRGFAVALRLAAVLAICAGLLLSTGCAGKSSLHSPTSSGQKKRLSSGTTPRKKASKPVPDELAGEDAHYVKVKAANAAKASKFMSPASQGLSSWNDLAPYVRACYNYASTKPAGVPATTMISPAPTWGLVARTAGLLLNLLPHLDNNPELLEKKFNWYAIKPKPVMTGYYSPVLSASHRRTGNFRYPIYSKPQGSLQGLDRKAIQNGALTGKGYEIAWTDSLFDLYNLQVQGGGVLRFTDGSTMPILYSGSNGKTFKPLSHIVRDRGLLPVSKLNLWAVKSFFDENPHLLRPLLEENPSYVFFSLAESGPLGSMGAKLVPGVSVAVDPDVVPLGSIMALFAHMPEGKKSVRGLVLANDKGSAISGAEIDFFTGHGERAARIAGRLKTRVWAYLLLAKN